ncbi:DUF2062 domain-containing protein [Desulforhopalus singaporensis]|nr:DUF2062 domain-containing protein [Desulforhopalus singaporensis]
MNRVDKQSVLLVIPLYNHAETVRKVIKQALETGYPVLVVDDGSTDGGMKKLDGVDIHRLQHKENLGKGAALKDALAFAKEQGFEAIVTIDADGQHDPRLARCLVEEAGRGPWPAIVIGARRMEQETVPCSSLFGRSFSNFWVRLECGLDLPDTQSGMRLYPVREMVMTNLKRNRYDFEIEALVKAAWAGVDVRSVDVPVHYPPPEERVSHFHKLIDNLRLTLLHSGLVLRRLLPIPHHRLTGNRLKEELLVVKNPMQTLKNLCRESASPFWLAVAVWVGLFLGVLPLIACHTIAIIYVTYRLRLNKVAAVAASQFCMPPIVPALCIEVGYFMRTGGLLLDLSWNRWVLEVHHRLWEWLLGSLVVSPILAFIGAALVYRLAATVQRRKVADVS